MKDFKKFTVITLILSLNLGFCISGRHKHSKEELKQIHSHAKKGHVEEVASWIERIGDAKAKHRDKGTLLHTAAKHGRTGVIEVVLNAGLQVDVRGGELKNTALHVACWKGKLEVVRQLLDAGANIFALNKHKISVFDYAVDCNHIDIVKELCSRASVIDLINGCKSSPLETTIFYNRFEVFKQLIYELKEVGGTIFSLTHDHKDTLYCVISSESFSSLEKVTFLEHLFSIRAFLSELDVVCVNDNSRNITSLHSSVLENEPLCVRLLLQHGADPHCYDRSNGHTPLQYACMYGSLEIIKVFFENLDCLNDELLRDSAWQKQLLQLCKYNDARKEVRAFLQRMFKAFEFKTGKGKLC